jgi:hypothetical protein
MHARTLVALTAAVAPLLIPAAANAATETLLLDSYDNAGAPYSRAVTTSQAIPAGTTATVTVRGTYALYTKSLMDKSHKPYVLCGSPVAAPPVTPSPGLSDSIAGFDAEFIYRRPFVGTCSQALPLANGAFQVLQNGGWSHPEAVGHPSAPTADHTYKYSVAGTGKPLSFRVRDDYTSDNDGVLAVSVAVPDGAGSAAAKPAASVVALSAPKSCASRRRFPIHLSTSQRDRAVSATVRVNGRTAKVVKRRAGKGKNGFVSTIDLRGLPKGTVKVKVVIRTKAGKVLAGGRTYHTCVPRKSTRS